jgi:hypothetical protein
MSGAFWTAIRNGEADARMDPGERTAVTYRGAIGG